MQENTSKISVFLRLGKVVVEKKILGKKNFFSTTTFPSLEKKLIFTGIDWY